MLSETFQPSLSDSDASTENNVNHFLTIIIFCSEKVFDWLNLDDLVALSTTCKQLKHMTADYVQQKYPMKQIRIHHDERKSRAGFLPRNKSVQRFAPNFRNIIIKSKDELLTVSKQNKQLDSIFFWHSEFSLIENQLIAQVVSNVKTISLLNVTLEGGLFENILRHCTRLKHLVIQHNFREYITNKFQECMNVDEQMKWQFNSYCPTLEHFCWYGLSLPTNLDTFIERNPSIRSLQTGNFVFNDTIELFKRANISVDDLYLGLVSFDSDDLTESIRDLNLLYARQKFKNLMLKFNVGSNLDEEKWSQMKYLTGICCSVPEIKSSLAIESTHLKLLILKNRHLSPSRAVSLSQKLVNLETLYLRINSIEQIVPFIQNSVNLKEIYVYKMYGSSASIQVSALNAIRRKLNGACKLSIYLPDDAYVQMKWENYTVDCSFIEIIRNDSHVSNCPFVINCIRYD